MIQKRHLYTNGQISRFLYWPLATDHRSLLLILLLICLVSDLPRCSHAQPDTPVFSVSCRDASLRDVLGNLAAQKGVNIAGLDVISPSVTLTANLNGVPLESGLRALLEPRGFTLEKRGGIYFIGQDAQKARGLSLSVSDGRMTVDANRVDVNDVVRALASSGISISSASNLTGQVTAHLRSEPLESALRVLFADFTLQVLEGIYRVEPPRKLRESGLTVLITDSVVSIAAQGASLALLLSELAARAKINLSVVGDMKRQITLRLGNRNVSELLTDLAVMTGYTYRRVDDMHFFGTPEIKETEVNPLIDRKTIWLTHLKADTVLNLLPISIPKQNIVVSATHNTVTVVGSQRLIRETEQFLAELDTDDDAIRGRRKPGAISIDVDNDTGLLTVDLLNAPRVDVVRELSIRTGMDMVFLGAGEATPASEVSTSSSSARSADADPDPIASTDTVTLRQTDATLSSVLSALFLGSDYGYKWAKSNPDAKRMLVIGSEMQTPFSESELIALHYLAVPKAMELLPTPLEVNINPLNDRSALLATGSSSRIDAFRKYLHTIDVPQQQAMIQLYLLELTKGNRDELGLTIGAADNRTGLDVKGDGFGLSFDSLSSAPQAFNAKLAALVKQNRGKMLANPSLAVVNGEKASIDIGGKHLFETNNPIYPTIGGSAGEPSYTAVGGYGPSIYRSLFTIETGILLELTPVIGASGVVTMTIQLTIRNADQVSRQESSLDQRLIQTTISVADQGVVVLGGLLQEKEIQEVSRVPILNRIPLLGGLLFTSKETTVEQTELIVIIQPKVIKSDELHLFTDN